MYCRAGDSIQHELISRPPRSPRHGLDPIHGRQFSSLGRGKPPEWKQEAAVGLQALPLLIGSSQTECSCEYPRFLNAEAGSVTVLIRMRAAGTHAGCRFLGKCGRTNKIDPRGL